MQVEGKRLVDIDHFAAWMDGNRDMEHETEVGARKRKTDAPFLGTNDVPQPFLHLLVVYGIVPRTRTQS